MPASSFVKPGIIVSWLSIVNLSLLLSICSGQSILFRGGKCCGAPCGRQVPISPKNKFCQCTYSYSCSSILQVRFFSIYKVGTGYIQVSPLCIAYELLKNFGSRNRLSV